MSLSVSALTVTVFDVFAFMSPKSQSSWFPPVISHCGLSGSSTQVSPTTPVGRVSLSFTLLATPGPAFPTSIVKTTSSPALMFCASGVFSTVRFGFSQVILPSSESFGALVADAVAVLL